jgi:hypothetical protein
LYGSLPADDATGYVTEKNPRYVQDAAGNGVFLLGYYCWTGHSLDHTADNPGVLRTQIDAAYTYGLKYIRISLGINRMETTDTYDGSTLRVPFLYTGGEADLSQWDSTFWTELKASIAYAEARDVLIHLAFFDGVDIKAGSEVYRYSHSYWNVANQTSSFYGDVDYNANGDIEESGEFYQTTAFTNGTGIGQYQKALIAKTITEVDGYSNVFYEIGNELSNAPSAWHVAALSYARSLTDKLVTINNCVATEGCGAVSSPGMWAQHKAATPAAVKTNVASIVGNGYPAMEDPDGPALMSGSASDLRKAAWYSLTGGASGWGGFSTDLWDTGSVNTTKLTYYKYLMDFLNNNSIRFYEMVPSQSLISNNTSNSLIANTGKGYLGYVLSDATVDITLASGTYGVKYINTATGVSTNGTDTTGPATRTFNKPSGASDWAVYVFTRAPEVTELPAGLILSSTGLISGTPLGPTGTVNFTVEVIDSVPAWDVADLSIIVGPPVATGNTVLLTSIEDTKIKLTEPAVNFSAIDNVRVKSYPDYTVQDRALYDITTAALPDNSTILSATFNAHYYGRDASGGYNPMRIYAYRISGTTPTISTVTWNSWAGTLQPYESYADVSLVPGWYSWDVTQLVKWAYENASHIFIALDGGTVSGAETNRYFYSVEGPAQYRPYISVTYSSNVAEGGPTIPAPGKMRVSKMKGTFR